MPPCPAVRRNMVFLLIVWQGRHGGRQVMYVVTLHAQEAEEDECHCPPLSPSVYLQSGIAAYGVNSSDSGWVDFISLILSGDILTDVPRVCFHGDSRSSLVDSEDRSSQNRSPEYSSSLWQFACQAWRLGKPKCPQALMLGEGSLQSVPLMAKEQTERSPAHSHGSLDSSTLSCSEYLLFSPTP